MIVPPTKQLPGLNRSKTENSTRISIQRGSNKFTMVLANYDSPHHCAACELQAPRRSHQIWGSPTPSLLELALRILTLTEFRVRQALAQTTDSIVALNPAAPSQPTQQPTTDRILAAFNNIHLTFVRLGEQTLRHVTALNPTQRQILALLALPHDLYDRLGRSPP